MQNSSQDLFRYRQAIRFAHEGQSRESTVHEKFIEDNKNDFVFLHLPIDENLDMWRKSMDKLPMDGRQNFKIRQDSGLGELFIPDKNIPKHILIYKKGKLRTLEAISSANHSLLEMVQKMIDEK